MLRQGGALLLPSFQDALACLEGRLRGRCGKDGGGLAQRLAEKVRGAWSAGYERLGISELSVVASSRLVPKGRARGRRQGPTDTPGP